jgi:hypothetical protein
MTEPVNVTTESGAAADGDATTGDVAAPSGHGDPTAPGRGTDDAGGDADFVPEH